MSKEKTIKLTKVEHEEIKQIHYTKTGLMDMIGVMQERRDNFIRRVAEKHNLGEFRISINIETGRITKK